MDETEPKSFAISALLARSDPFYKTFCRGKLECLPFPGMEGFYERFIKA